jgi:hypothetical protein
MICNLILTVFESKCLLTVIATSLSFLYYLDSWYNLSLLAKLCSGYVCRNHVFCQSALMMLCQSQAKILRLQGCCESIKSPFHTTSLKRKGAMRAYFHDRQMFCHWWEKRYGHLMHLRRCPSYKFSWWAHISLDLLCTHLQWGKPCCQHVVGWWSCMSSPLRWADVRRCTLWKWLQ